MKLEKKYSPENVKRAKNAALFLEEPADEIVISLIDDALKFQAHILELENHIAEIEQERRWIPVSEYPSQQGWYRVIINDGTEKVRFYKRDTENNREYWHVANNKEWIIMWFNPCLPQPPKEEE